MQKSPQAKPAVRTEQTGMQRRVLCSRTSAPPDFAAMLRPMTVTDPYGLQPSTGERLPSCLSAHRSFPRPLRKPVLRRGTRRCAPLIHLHLIHFGIPGLSYHGYIILSTQMQGKDIVCTIRCKGRTLPYAAVRPMLHAVFRFPASSRTKPLRNRGTRTHTIRTRIPFTSPLHTAMHIPLQPAQRRSAPPMPSRGYTGTKAAVPLRSARFPLPAGSRRPVRYAPSADSLHDLCASSIPPLHRQYMHGADKDAHARDEREAPIR